MGRRLVRAAMAGSLPVVVMCALSLGGLGLVYVANGQTGPFWCTPLVDCLGSGGKVGLDDWLNAKLYTEQWELIRTTRQKLTTTPVTLTSANGTNQYITSDNTTAKTINLFAGQGGETLLFRDKAGSVITISGNGTTIQQGATGKGQIVSSGTQGDFCALVADNLTNWDVIGCVGFN